MRYTGIQPHYFPRLHYIARLLNTDIFVLRDEVQYVKKHKYPDGKNGPSYQSHTPIATSDGEYLLSVPTKKGMSRIIETKVTYDHPWMESHLLTIHHQYAKSPFFDNVYPEINILLQEQYESLADLNIATLVWALSYLLDLKGIDIGATDTALLTRKLSEIPHPYRIKKILRGSHIPVLSTASTLTASEKILGVCKELGITEDYCGGTAVAAYFDQKLFEKNGITVTVQNWKCAPYTQPFGRRVGFLPNMSILDLLMNMSPKRALEILTTEE